jgi:hypothetical protein
MRTRRLHLIVERWCDRYGPVFRFDLGPRRFVAIGDLDEINSILRDRPDGFRRWRELRENADETPSGLRERAGVTSPLPVG